MQATVVHENADILRLAFSDGSEVTGTGRHRFWSETRRDWVAARALREGEELRTPSGVVRVESATPSHTLTAVYNLEVEGAHEYFVGEGEVLVHNGGCADEAADATRGVGEIDDDVAEAMGSAYERRTTASGGTQVLERSMGGSGPRRWQEVPQAQTSRPHGNSRNAPYAELYARTDSNGRFQKWGISRNASTRYSRTELAEGTVDVLRRGTRAEMLALERRLTGSRPGPLNFEPWRGFRRPGHPKFDPNWRTR